MGRSSIVAALQASEPDEPNLILLSSSVKEIKVLDSNFLAADLESKQLLNAGGTLIHTAFLTRDHFTRLGPHEYEKQNLQILDSTVQLIRKARPTRIIFINSGASKSLPYGSRGDESYRLYAGLKNRESEVIKEVGSAIGSDVTEGVLFSATGAFMKSPKKFAIGNILQQTSQGTEIRLTSRARVWRRYCDSIQWMRALIELSNQGGSGRLESGGVLIELGSLAEEITKVVGQKLEVVRNLDPLETDDFYFSTSNDFERILLGIGIPPITLAEQIATVRDLT